MMTAATSKPWNRKSPKGRGKSRPVMPEQKAKARKVGPCVSTAGAPRCPPC